MLEKGRAPLPRQSHAAASIGSLMLVHGGQSVDLKATLNDFSLFDMKL
jgi:hypothetical protein